MKKKDIEVWEKHYKALNIDLFELTRERSTLIVAYKKSEIEIALSKVKAEALNNLIDRAMDKKFPITS